MMHERALNAAVFTYTEDLPHRFSLVSATPAQASCQVVPSAERDDTHTRLVNKWVFVCKRRKQVENQLLWQMSNVSSCGGWRPRLTNSSTTPPATALHCYYYISSQVAFIQMYFISPCCPFWHPVLHASSSKCFLGSSTHKQIFGEGP